MSPRLVARHATRALTVPLILAALAAPALPRVVHGAPAAMRTITVSAAHLTFPKTIPAGMLAVRARADTADGLYMGFARLNPGATVAQVEAASTAGDLMRLSRLVTFIGGVGVPAGSRGTAVLDLRTPGQYGVHVQRGDQDPGHDLLFTVTGTGAPAAVAPRARVDVTLAGTRYVGLPTALPAGTTTFKVTNRSSWLRDMVIFRLDPGKTVKDMIAATKEAEQTHQDPAWVHDAGDADLLSPHQTEWVTLDFTPGSYVAFCPLSDPQKGGEPFALEGMIAPFTVS
jgi:hypothetical protein